MGPAGVGLKLVVVVISEVVYKEIAVTLIVDYSPLPPERIRTGVSVSEDVTVWVSEEVDTLVDTVCVWETYHVREQANKPSEIDSGKARIF
jgi:hypothetical protein